MICLYSINFSPSLELARHRLVVKCCGYPDQAKERARYAFSLAQTLSHPFSLVDTLGHTSMVYLFVHKAQEAQALVEVLLPLTHEHGFAWWLAIGTCLQGWVLVERAAWSEARDLRETGLGQLGEGLAALRDMEAELYVPLFLGAMAQGYGQGDQVNEGLKVVAEALALVEKNQERWNEAELYRLQGELTLAHEGNRQKAKGKEPKNRAHIPSSESEAETCFLKAIEIAKDQGARSWELRAATSLARLWQSQGKCQEAYDLLASVYGWFTEGFDTADLKSAKALLTELRV